MAPVLPWMDGGNGAGLGTEDRGPRSARGTRSCFLASGRCWQENATAWFKGKKDAGISDLASNCQSNSSSH